MGFADTNVLPMEMLGRMVGNSIDYIWHSIWTVPMQGLNKTKVGREHTLAFLPFLRTKKEFAQKPGSHMPNNTSCFVKARNPTPTGRVTSPRNYEVK